MLDKEEDRKAIEELRTIYRRHYKEDISFDGAWEMGNRLLRLFKILYTNRDTGEPWAIGDACELKAKGMKKYTKPKDTSL